MTRPTIPAYLTRAANGHAKAKQGVHRAKDDHQTALLELMRCLAYWKAIDPQDVHLTGICCTARIHNFPYCSFSYRDGAPSQRRCFFCNNLEDDVL